MTYLNKYLKYKAKYLEKKKNILVGGAKSEVVFLLGGPGSGKGTVADRISADFGYIQLTNSAVVKEEMNNVDADPCLRKQIRESITNGSLIPPEISTRLLRKKIIELGLGKKILIDGYPRSIDRLKIWIDLNKDIADIKFILFLNCNPETLYCRALQRGEQTGRSDDTKDTIRKRIDTYIKETLPVLEFGKTVCNVVNIDGNKSKSEVYEKVRQSFLSDAKSEVVFVVGGPGCGKGTISERISSEYGYLSITNSALLRDEMNNEATDPSLRQQIRVAISEGSILPTEILISILKKKLVELGPGKKIIIDGFPRNIEQLNIFLKECYDIVNIKFILFLNCSPETMMERARRRGLLTGREDDTLGIIQNRISVYTTVTVHVMDEASRKGVRVVEIDSNKAVDEVYKDVKQHF
jgi:adenylate kinase